MKKNNPGHCCGDYLFLSFISGTYLQHMKNIDRLRAFLILRFALGSRIESVSGYPLKTSQLMQLALSLPVWPYRLPDRTSCNTVWINYVVHLSLMVQKWGPYCELALQPWDTGPWSDSSCWRNLRNTHIKELYCIYIRLLSWACCLHPVRSGSGHEVCALKEKPL